MLSALEISKMTGSTLSKAEQFASYLNDAMAQNGINTPARILAFLSQIGHESGGLKYTEEIASGDKYDTRTDLGNTPEVDGDGRKYKGRGLMQITGHANYAKMSSELGQDFVNKPYLLSEPKWAALSAARWWKNRGLNEIADGMDISKGIEDEKNKEVFKKITKKINGGYNGLTDRINRWIAGSKNMATATVENIEQAIKKNPNKTIGIVLVTSALLLLTFTLVYAGKNVKPK
jgi:putative chitinase